MLLFVKIKAEKLTALLKETLLSWFSLVVSHVCNSGIPLKILEPSFKIPENILKFRILFQKISGNPFFKIQENSIKIPKPLSKIPETPAKLPEPIARISKNLVTIPEPSFRIPENSMKAPNPRKVNAFTSLKCIEGVRFTLKILLITLYRNSLKRQNICRIPRNSKNAKKQRKMQIISMNIHISYIVNPFIVHSRRIDHKNGKKSCSSVYTPSSLKH